MQKYTGQGESCNSRQPLQLNFRSISVLADFLTTSEVAEYLRIKERTVYELVRTRRIPCSRVTGRLIFPKTMIDAWVRLHIDYEGPAVAPAPPVIAGSHDPLLEWAVRESSSDLALMSGGSSDGLQRLERRQAVAAGLHVLNPANGDYNRSFISGAARWGDLVLIHWAWRDQGLVVAPNNPHRIQSIVDLSRPGITIACRQEGAGSQILLRHLLEQAGVPYQKLSFFEPALRTETDLAAMVLDGKADCGLAIASASRRFRLGFVPLRRERFDLAMNRRDYFEGPLQRLLWFTRGTEFTAYASALGGYDVAKTGEVIL
jgi:putative molybdopterin biosynthesis protein